MPICMKLQPTESAMVKVTARRIRSLTSHAGRRVRAEPISVMLLSVGQAQKSQPRCQRAVQMP